MKRHLNRIVFSLTVVVLPFTGCTNQTPSSTQSSGSSTALEEHHAHDHPAVGPHHGELVELGSEYHAEILHDDKGTVTLYVLDLGATQQVPIDAPDVTINARHDGKPVQFKLAASPDADDPAGKSSRFITTDEALVRCLDDEAAEPRLVISITGKSYRGIIAHGHDHAGHDH